MKCKILKNLMNNLNLNQIININLKNINKVIICLKQ